MSKYYKAEDVIRAIAEHLCWIARTEYGGKFTTEDWLEEAEDYVSDLPTIDIVRCNTCKHCLSEEIEETMPIYIYCDLWKGETEFDSYCSYGERIEE